MQPFFSIITASLNMGKSLEHTIESIRAQTFRDVEHIVVDGKSTDNTIHILESCEKSYNLKWISEPDRGVPDAFNKAIGLSSGQYVIAIQADDYLLNESVLENVYQVISVDKKDIYSFPIIKEIIPGKPRQINPIPHLWWLRFRNIFPHQGIFVKRVLFEKVGSFDLQFTITEDYDFLYRAIRQGCSVSFQNMPVSYMGAEGPCSVDEFLLTRLHEEYRLQAKNERNVLWRFLQVLFWIFYYPYKAKFLTSP